MWRRRFLDDVCVNACGGGRGHVRQWQRARSGRDIRERASPFINAGGHLHRMTASLMPPEVMEAINYASKHYVMLDELHDRVGERIAKLVRAEAAMVTSGAASALTLGTAAVLTGMDRQKIGDLPNLTSMKSEVIIRGPRSDTAGVRKTGVRLWSREARRPGTRGNREDRVSSSQQQKKEGGSRRGLVRREEAGIPRERPADDVRGGHLWKYTPWLRTGGFSGGKASATAKRASCWEEALLPRRVRTRRPTVTPLAAA